MALVRPCDVPVQLFVDVALVGGAVHAGDLGPGQMATVLARMPEFDLNRVPGQITNVIVVALANKLALEGVNL